MPAESVLAAMTSVRNGTRESTCAWRIGRSRGDWRSEQPIAIGPPSETMQCRVPRWRPPTAFARRLAAG